MYNTKYNTKYNNKYNSKYIFKYVNNITCIKYVYDFLLARFGQCRATGSSQIVQSSKMFGQFPNIHSSGAPPLLAPSNGSWA